MPVDVKICGIRDEAALKAAAENGARYVGFVFVSSSRHCIAPAEAGKLAALVPDGVKTVGLFVDPDDATIRSVTGKARLDIIQLHGLETPERVKEVRSLTGLPVMKAVHIATEKDFADVPAYEAAADMLLFDTKTGPVPTGGTGKSFDWSLLKGRTFSLPWMLAGGINIGNIAEAVAITGARTVDVSSGVENHTGNKSPEKIEKLLGFARFYSFRSSPL